VVGIVEDSTVLAKQPNLFLTVAALSDCSSAATRDLVDRHPRCPERLLDGYRAVDRHGASTTSCGR
jgi:putative ABC transport system permease protein